MSIVETLTKGRVGRPASPKPQYTEPQAPKIAGKLVMAEEALETARAAFAQAAYANSVGEGDVLALEDAQRVLADAERHVETLRAAHAVALRQDDAHLDGQRQALRQSQLEALRKHLHARDAAAKDLSEALAKAGAAYRALQDKTSKALAACPVGAEWPARAEFTAGHIERLVAAEMHRVSAGPDGKGALPGAATDPMHRHNAEALRPLSEVISQASAFATEKLTAFVRGDR